ncbi:MAG: hypothetical protein ACOCW6_09010 [Spirochaetota bacterium]
MSQSPSATVINLASRLPAVHVHNTLMVIPDRELALATLYMDDSQRQSLLAHLGASKRRRVEEEIALQERLEIRYDHYRRALEGVLGALSNQQSTRLGPSYLRPTTYRRSG